MKEETEKSLFIYIFFLSVNNDIFSIEDVLIWHLRLQVGSTPSQAAVLPERTHILVWLPPVSREPGEQEYVQLEPTSLDWVQEKLPLGGVAREGQRMTEWKRTKSTMHIIVGQSLAISTKVTKVLVQLFSKKHTSLVEGSGHLLLNAKEGIFPLILILLFSYFEDELGD